MDRATLAPGSAAVAGGTAPLSTAPLLEIRGLTKSYRGFTLGPVDLAVPHGVLFGLIGPNGAGKTTLLHSLMGLVQPGAGRATLAGLDFKHDEAAFKGRIGFSDPVLNWNAWGRVGRVLDFLRPFYPNWDDAYADALLHRFELDRSAKVAALSFGSQTKLALTAALAHRPALLLLDEPTAGLDAAARRVLFEELLAAVEDGTRSAIVSSHDLADLERYTDRVGILHRGRLLAEGAPAELCERHAQLVFAPPAGWVPPSGVRVLRRTARGLHLLLDLDHAAALETASLPLAAAVPVNLEEFFLALTADAATESAS